MSANLRSEASVPMSEVGAELDHLATQHKLMSDIIDHLEQRLDAVLSQRKSGASVDAAGSPEPVRVRLAQQVHEHVAHVSSMNDRLSSLLNRIEL